MNNRKVESIISRKSKLIKKLKEKNELLKELKDENLLLKRQIEQYKKEAFTDSLTKLNNRRSIIDKEGFDAVILGDIDHFKMINDTYGHEYGDKVLVEIGVVLQKYVRDTDLACRWGGEEFVILLKNCSDHDAYKKAIILKHEISKLSKKFGFKISMSFGVSTLRGKTMQNAIKEADEAMYTSKRNGRDTVTVYKLKNS